MTEEKEICKCFKSEDKDEYWGYWLECECGYNSNVEHATYCGGCGKKIEVIGRIKNPLHFGER